MTTTPILRGYLEKALRRSLRNYLDEHCNNTATHDPEAAAIEAANRIWATVTITWRDERRAKVTHGRQTDKSHA